VFANCQLGALSYLSQDKDYICALRLPFQKATSSINILGISKDNMPNDYYCPKITITNNARVIA